MKEYFTLFLMLISCSLIGQPRYYKAQMHCHTTNSDGGYSPQNLVEKYKNAGYEIMFITDHNYLTLESEVNVSGVLVIQSEEITFDRHMNAFFLNSLIQPTSGYTCQDAIDAVKAQGGLIQLNHYCQGPFTEPSWAVSVQEIITFSNGPDFLEIWNTGTESVQTHDDKSIWDEVLTSGKVVWGSATDDFHPSVMESLEFNKGWNMIWLDTLTEQNVFNALQTGQFYASTGVVISSYTVTDYVTYKTITLNSNASKIAFWGPGHQKIQESNGGSASFILQSHSYVRAELVKEGFLGIGNTYGWTQPVFLNNPVATLTQTDMIPTMNIFPNPTEGLAQVKLSLPYISHVKISVADLAGREVKVLCNEFLTPKDYVFPVSLYQCSSGMYILKLESDYGSKSMLFDVRTGN